jgi:serine/threonine-protein kinase
VLLVVGGVAFALLASGGDKKQVTVPDVAGQPVAQAQAALTNAKFEVQLQTVTDAAVDRGLAIGTDPTGGTSADQGSTVVLRVSGGPGESTVPDVTGKTEDQATTALTRAGFQVDTKTEASPSVAKGLVISQDPAGAATAEKGSTVTITVSSGTGQVTVPDVSGQSQSSAEQAIRNAGLVPSASTSPSSSDTPGTVISQDPGGGGKADKGSTVSIVIATAPANVTVPDVIGNTASDARFKLVNAGFQVTSDTADSSEPAGNVIDQNPASGTSVAPGSRIVITVSNGPSSTPTVPAPPPAQTTP